MINKYDVAATEVLEIINYLEKNEKNKIPESFIQKLRSKSIDSYKSELDFSKAITEIKLKPETRALLALIYREYLCDERDKKEFNKLLQENEEKYLNEQRQKYNPDNLFKKDKYEVQGEKNNNEMKLEVAKKKTIINRIIEKIKSIIKFK